MWKENIIALKEKVGKSYKQIADGVSASESTVKRVFSRKIEDNKRGHSMDLIIAIIHFLGGTVSEVFEDTGVMIYDQNLVALQESVINITAERDSAVAENLGLKEQLAALNNELLRTQLTHKDEIIALYKLLYRLQNADTKGES